MHFITVNINITNMEKVVTKKILRAKKTHIVDVAYRKLETLSSPLTLNCSTELKMRI